MLLQASTTELFAVGDLRLIAPELILAVFACVALVMEVVLPARLSRVVGYFALAGLALAAVSLALLGWPYLSAPFGDGFAPAPLEGFYGTLRVDGFAVVFKLIFLLSAALAVALSFRYLDVEGEQRGEFYALVLFATTGMMFLASGYDLIVLYISLELMAVTFYVLVAYARRERRSNEAGLKYFLLGAFSSGVLLYGMSLLFGVGGSTNLGEIAPRLADAVLAPANTGEATLRPLALLAMIAVAAGLFFKVAAAPFHMWAPDAYEGAPTPVTAFLSTGSKAASFAFFARLFLDGLGGMRADWAPLLGLVAALTIFVGNWAAVTQTNAKRLLAYSSVSNAGYLLLGLVAANAYGYTGLAVYTLVYVFMNAGAFGVIISLRRRDIAGEDVESLNGLGRKSPALALAMAVFMLSLGGLPATGGFVGKWFLFGGLIERGAAEGRNWYYWLAGWAALNTVVSFYYYVRFIRAMYISERPADSPPLALSTPLKGALAVCAAAVVFIGVYPHPVIKLAEALVSSLGVGAPLALR
ncbi:MAG TPA: NADH-quinone oxidoreductase subunit N [Pyrinomonadaceae bacterium]|nr:NADH-quinone oxidoreductase subunit N [Pyrinomonadaceae bacterium]